MVERIGGWLNNFIDWVINWRVFDSAGRTSSKLFIVSAVFAFLALRGLMDDSTGQMVLFGILAAIGVVRGMDEKRSEDREFLAEERRDKTDDTYKPDERGDIWD